MHPTPAVISTACFMLAGIIVVVSIASLVGRLNKDDDTAYLSCSHCREPIEQFQMSTDEYVEQGLGTIANTWGQWFVAIFLITIGFWIRNYP